MLARRDLTIAAIVLVFALQEVIRFNSHLDPEVTWYLYAGGRLLDGADLYIDVVEFIPPFVIWLSMPIVAMARTIGVNVTIIFQSVLLVLSVVSIALSARFIAAATDVSASTRHLIVILLAGLMLFLPASDFGQRDHIVIVLATPWVLLRWNRLIDREVPWAFAVLVGLMAAVGLWMKPNFLFVVLALEITILFVARSARTSMRTENLAIVAVGAAYLMAIWLSEFKSLVPIALLGARAFIPIYGVAFEEIVLRLVLPVALAAIAIAGFSLMTPKLQLLQKVLIVVGAAFIFVYFVQSGSRFQLIPALFFLALAVGLVVARVAAGEITFANVPERIVVAGAAMAILVVFADIWSAQFVPYHGRLFERAIATEAPEARSVFIASADVSHPFPLVEENGLIWASRFSSQWLAPHVATKLDEDGGPADDIGRRLLKSTVDDLMNSCRISSSSMRTRFGPNSPGRLSTMSGSGKPI